MPKYLIEASYSHEGFEGVRTKGGSSRRDAIAQAAKSMGGKLEAFYFAFGEHDRRRGRRSVHEDDCPAYTRGGRRRCGALEGRGRLSPTGDLSRSQPESRAFVGDVDPPGRSRRAHH